GGAFCFYWHLNNAGKVGPMGLDANLILQNLTLVLWPSSLMLFSLTGQHLWSTIIIESISVITNGFIYMGVGSVFIKLLRKVAANAGDFGHK
ncbi:MAG TPA: hypothetical protein VFB76_10010, partial [Candidatus Angelobacter sp.]|nr:hypothetical protein [Candidatus Angelobacter sp.]